jgi:hypothetical protein
MLPSILTKIARKEEYFNLAQRTDYKISLNINQYTILYYNEDWSTDDKWRFWLDNEGYYICFGTIQQVIKQANDPSSINVVLKEHQGDLKEDLWRLEERLMDLQGELYQHVLKWEEKIIYPNYFSPIAPDSKINFKTAKQIVKNIYQLFLFYTKQYLLNPSKEDILIVAQFRAPEGDSGSLFYDKARNSFVVNINDNCVEEIDSPLLPILLQMVEKQSDFLTVGQIGVLQFFGKLQQELI